MITAIRFMRHVMRMPMPWPLCVVVLFLTNMGAVVFLPRLEAWVVLGALGLGAMLQMALFSRVGFVRLLGIGHVHWLVMVAWLLSRLDTIAEPALYRWVRAVIVVCSLSLAIDAAYVLGVALALSERASVGHRPRGLRRRGLALGALSTRHRAQP